MHTCQTKEGLVTYRGDRRGVKTLDTPRGDSYSKWCGRLPLAAGVKDRPADPPRYNSATTTHP